MKIDYIIERDVVFRRSVAFGDTFKTYFGINAQVYNAFNFFDIFIDFRLLKTFFELNIFSFCSDKIEDADLVLLV